MNFIGTSVKAMANVSAELKLQSETGVSHSKDASHQIMTPLASLDCGAPAPLSFLPRRAGMVHFRSMVKLCLYNLTAGLLAIFALLAATALHAAVKAEKDSTDPGIIVMQNDLLRIEINLQCGAHVTSYRYKGFAEGDKDPEIVFDWKTENGGLLKDLWYMQGWPGEFDKRLYEAEIVKAGPDEAVVKTWTMSTGVFGNKTKEDLAGIKLVKTFRLKDGSRILNVAYEFTNQAEKGRRPAFWSQHAFDFDGKRKNSVYWRSTRFGIDWISEEKRSSEYGYWYVAQVNAGWNGTTNRQLKRGLMFLMDYNDLMQVYDNSAANTTEWMYDDVAIPAGKTWKTDVSIIPTEGFVGYTYGSPDLIGFVEAKEVPGGLRVEHTVAAAAGELKDAVITTEVVAARAGWQVKGDDIKVATLGMNPLTQTVVVPGIGPMPCVVKVTVSGTGTDGKQIKAQYADYFGGKAGRNQDLVTLDPIFPFPVPEKQKQYLKPDKIALQHLSPPKILFVRGLWAEYHGLDEALKLIGDVTVVDAWMKKSALGETLGNFPASYEDLLSYDVIILANVSGPMLAGVGQEMLADYVKAGGGLLMMGGDRTYGQTSFSNPNFENLVPLTSGMGDYGKLKTASGLAVKSGAPVGAGVAFKGDEIVLYAHTVKPKEGSVVAAALTDGTPVLILSGDDKARVAAVTLLPFGEAPAGKVLYGESPAWQKLMAETVKWLMKR